MPATMPRAETDPAYAAGGATDAELAAAIAGREVTLAGTLDSAPGRIAIVPDTASDENGVVVKAPDETWGEGTYGTGDAFLLLREDYAGGSEVEPDRNVLFRVDGHTGGVGTAGGIHVATGLRAHEGDVFGYSIYVDPAVDVTGVIIDAASDAPAADYLLARTNGGTVKAKIDSIGNIQAQPGAAAEVMIGNVATLPAITFGSARDTSLYRAAAEVLALGNDCALEFEERPSDIGAPGVNRGRLFARDNGSGKTQICARFNTGAVVVIATQP